MSIEPLELPENPTDKMIQNAMSEDKPLTEAQEALKFYNEALTVFLGKVKNYEGSKKQLQELLSNLALSLMHSDKVHNDPSYPAQQELFELGEHLFGMKVLLSLHQLEKAGRIIFVEEEPSPLKPASITEQENAETSAVEKE